MVSSSFQTQTTDDLGVSKTGSQIPYWLSNRMLSTSETIADISNHLTEI